MKPDPAEINACATCGMHARTTRAFAALGDHQRLPWRFFARLHAADGSLLSR